MKNVDKKISMFLNNIIDNYFDLEEPLSQVFDGVTLNAFCELKAEFDYEHEEDNNE